MSKGRNGSNSKPRSLPEQARKLLAQFGAEDRVLVAITADPDALGASLALKRLLWRRVASITIGRSNEIARPDNQTMTRLLHIPTEPLETLKDKDFSKVVMLDSQPHHNEAFAWLKPQVVIDHHPLNNGALSEVPFVDVRPSYGATCSILTEYLQGAQIKPSPRLATALLFGIKNDTSAFQRPCIAEDIKAFQYLYPMARLTMLRKIEFSEMRVGDLNTLRKALDRATRRKHTMYAHMGSVKSPDNLVQIADFFLKVDVVDSCAVSGVHEGKLVVILRNTGPRTNAGKLAEQAFGHLGSAGGHSAMARAEMPYAKVKELISEPDDESVGRWVRRQIINARKRKKKG